MLRDSCFNVCGNLHKPRIAPKVVVSGCGSTDPEDRFQSAHDLRLQLAWIASMGSQAGVNLTRFPNAGAKYQVSLAGGIQPVWSKDGKQLYYVDAGQKLIAAEIRIEKDSVRVGAPRTLFQTSVTPSFDEAAYDVSREGRFLMMDFVIETPLPLTLVTNWDAELGR